MKVLLTTLNAKYIHKALSLRWLYVARDKSHETLIREFTIKDTLDRICNEIVSINPDVIGISTYIWNGEMVKKLCPMIKEKLPNCRIILGGPEVSYQYQDYLTNSVDAINLGEGEVTFWQYVNKQDNIMGLITHDYKNTLLPKVDIAYLETLESPYLLDFDLEDMDKRYLYVETSRGCPYQCKYCLASLDNKIRTFSLEYLFDLFDKLEKTKVRQVKFLDRTFNADKNRSMKIASRLLQFREDVSFQFEIMADTLDDSLVELIINNPVKSRFRFEVGIQSFNKDTLREVKRYQNLANLTKNLNSLISSDAIVHADLIAGLPCEDLNSFKDTYQKLFGLRTSEMQVGILKLLKGSALRKEMDKYNIKADQATPYTIISNDWMCKNDIDTVERVALASERLWNKDICKKTLWYLYENGTAMFDFMDELGKKIESLPRPYQVHQLFKLVDESLPDETSKLILLTEYYRLFKQRPVRYKYIDIDKKEKSEIFEKLAETKEVTRNDIRYAYYDYAFYANQKCVQVLIYNSDQRYPNRYYMSLDNKYLGKEDLNERYNDSYFQR